MKLTVEQALQQGVDAQKEGKLQEAKRFYRAVLRSQPNQADATHNLGIIAISLNKVDVALPLLKAALESEPETEKFWLSYIGALIKEKECHETKQVLKQAKTQGMRRESLQLFEAQLSRKSRRPTSVSMSPTQQQLDMLLEHYQNGRLGNAEELAVSISQEFPQHQFAWKVLGAVFRSTGRKSEAIDANRTAVVLCPDDAEALCNLGVTLEEYGSLGEAEACYTQAIVLRPDFSGAHNNLGDLLQTLGRLDEAELIFTKAIALKPDYAEAHNNLGNTLSEMGKLDEAEASYRRALALMPLYAVAHNNLGNLLKELGRLAEAESSFVKAIELKPDYAEAHNNLGNAYKELGRLVEAELNFTKAITLKPDLAEANFNIGALLRELGRLGEAEAYLRRATALKPDYAKAHDCLGVLLQTLGKFEEAELCYKACINHGRSEIPLTKSLASKFFKDGDFQKALDLFDGYNTPESRSSALSCLHALGKIEEIYTRIKETAESDDGNLEVAAFASFIAEFQQKDTAHRFCKKPLEFIHMTNISSKMDDSKRFLNSLIEDLRNIRTTWNPPNQSANGGFQTNGNIFRYSNQNIAVLREIILDEIDVYYEKFKTEDCSFIKKWPNEKKIKGWHIILKEQGFHNFHIHPDGWLSGVIYLKVPPSLNKNEGAILFNLVGSNTMYPDFPKITHNPEVGDMLLFPSSLHHGTVPFSTDTDRIVIAFDLMPGNPTRVMNSTVAK